MYVQDNMEICCYGDLEGVRTLLRRVWKVISMQTKDLFTISLNYYSIVYL